MAFWKRSADKCPKTKPKSAAAFREAPKQEDPEAARARREMKYAQMYVAGHKGITRGQLAAFREEE